MPTDHALLVVEGSILEGPHWTEPVRVLSVKQRVGRLEIHAIGVRSRQHTAKLIPVADIEQTVRISLPSERAALDGNPIHFRLAAEAHRIRLAFQYDPHFAVSVSQVDALPHQLDAVYPQEDRDVADQPQLSLVVLDLHHVVGEDEIPAETAAFVGQIVKHHGQGFRKHANALIFLAPDEQRAPDVLDAARRLLALRNIDEDTTTKKKLTDEQKKDLASRLKEAEARLPGALSSAYRHVVVPTANKDLRVFDMGIATLGADELLSNKVIGTLRDNDQLLSKLDPSLLIGSRWKLWPEEQDVVSLRTLSGYFTTLTHLPALMSLDVLKECVASGVERGLFGYALGDGEKQEFDTLRFKEAGIAVEIIDSSWLVRPELAKSLLPEPQPSHAGSDSGSGDTARSGSGEDETWGGSSAGGVKIVEGERRLDRVRIRMRIPWENWQDIYTEVIDPLAKEGADLICDVVIVAKGDGTIRENTVELGIRESLSQRGIDAEIETG